MPKKSAGEIALEKEIHKAKQHDSQFDNKVEYWNHLNKLDLSAEEIGKLMTEKFGKLKGGLMRRPKLARKGF